MLCRYSYLFKRRTSLFEHSPYYTTEFVDTPTYECDIEDFKKLFKQIKKDAVAIVVEFGNGELWVWQKSDSYNNRRLGWQQIRKAQAGYNIAWERQLETKLQSKLQASNK